MVVTDKRSRKLSQSMDDFDGSINGHSYTVLNFILCLNTLVRLLPKHFKLHRHCFNGDEMMYRKWKTSFPNCKFGISPFILNDQKYPKYRSLVCNMKLKDIVLETDAPYLHSEFEDFGSPLMIKDICEKLANIFLCSVEEIANITTKNATDVYSII